MSSDTPVTPDPADAGPPPADPPPGPDPAARPPEPGVVAFARAERRKWESFWDDGDYED